MTLIGRRVGYIGAGGVACSLLGHDSLHVL